MTELFDSLSAGPTLGTFMLLGIKKCILQPTIASDVISGVADDKIVVNVRVKFTYSMSNRS